MTIVYCLYRARSVCGKCVCGWKELGKAVGTRGAEREGLAESTLVKITVYCRLTASLSRAAGKRLKGDIVKQDTHTYIYIYI